jgi:hypothetical protein
MTAHANASKLPRPTEQACTSKIIAAARLAGWRCAHFRPARTEKGWRTAVEGHAGFPDLVLVRGRRLLFVELKRKPYKLTDAQLAWHTALLRTGAETLIVYVPEEMDAFIAEITERAA